MAETTNVVVIGGGTAGLEAACTAAEVGCTTYLFEQKPYLGGLAREIATLPAKSRIADFPNSLVRRAEKLKNLITFTNTRADIETIEKFKPDVVINATGSQPLLPPIKGLLERIDKEEENIFSIMGLLGNLDEFNNTDVEGKNIAVIGGGAVGLDVVEYFSHRGANVTIVERLPMLGRDLDHITRISMMSMIKEKNVTVHTNTSLMEVASDHFKLQYEGEDMNLEFDYGFVCLGMKPVNENVQLLQKHFAKQGVEFVNIGDSQRARKIMDGVREGRNIRATLKKIGAM